MEFINKIIAWCKSTPDPGFSFCESIHACSNAKWHIRQLSDKGTKLGGGIDTNSLCGNVDHTVGGWDLEVCLSEHHLQNNTCRVCAEKYKHFQSIARSVKAILYS